MKRNRFPDTLCYVPRYAYDLLQVLCFEPKRFALDDLRGAVEYLKTIDRDGFVGILVEVNVAAGRFKLRAPAFLRLEEIAGKKPSEVWEMLDAKVDRQIAYFEQRDGPFLP